MREPAEAKKKSGGAGADPAVKADQAAATLIPIIELCRYCPGMVTAMGVSVGLTASAILSKGTIEQKERWALDLLTLRLVPAFRVRSRILVGLLKYYAGVRKTGDWLSPRAMANQELRGQFT